MEDLTRLEKVIEATAEAETDLKPETRLEKVILDTGAKIQVEIAGAGGTLYNHKISLLYTSTRKPSFNIVSSSNEPLTLNDVINYLIDNEYTGKLYSTINGLTLNFSIAQYGSSSQYLYNACIYYDTSSPDVITINNVLINFSSPYKPEIYTGTVNNIIDTITEL